MIDHISIAVRDLVKGERFYAAALAPLGPFETARMAECRFKRGQCKKSRSRPEIERR